MYETILSGDLRGDDDMSQFGDYAEYLCREYRSSFTHEERQKAMEDFEQYLRNVAHIDDNVYSVVTAYEVDETAVLDGFTITGGNSFIINDFRYGPDMMRGAINIEKASPIIKNCVVRNNLALNGGGLASFHSTPMIKGCRFKHNFSRSDGGGLWHEHGSLAIVDCSFIRNYAIDDAGGVYFSHEGKPTLENCQIEGNIAGDDGGGIYCSKGCDALIKSNTVIRNIALNGGGITCKKCPRPEDGIRTAKAG